MSPVFADDEISVLGINTARSATWKNGRISLEKRGRINSGVGYAISINQIKNFMGHLRAGLQADHATLGAIIENKTEEGQTGMIVTSILESCDARRRVDDRIHGSGEDIACGDHVGAAEEHNAIAIAVSLGQVPDLDAFAVKE